MDVEPARVLERQDPSLIRGMATVGEESPAHLYIGELVFSGCLRVLSLVRKYKLPARGDEPLMGRWGAKRDGLIYTLKTADTVEGSYGDYHHARMVCNVGDPKVVKAIIEDWQRIMWEKDAANEPLVLVEDGRMVFRVEVPLPVESEE
jgi:hypothetical protein